MKLKRRKTRTEKEACKVLKQAAAAAGRKGV